MVKMVPQIETTTIIMIVSLYEFDPLSSTRRYWKSRASLMKEVDILYITFTIYIIFSTQVNE